MTGFVPWGAPSELVGIRCIQACVLVQFYRVGQFLTDPVLQYPFWDLFVHVLPKVLSMLLWAVWIVPGMLDVFSLPPFLDDLEYGLLLQTLHSYPNGLPADESAPRPLSAVPNRHLPRSSPRDPPAPSPNLSSVAPPP